MANIVIFGASGMIGRRATREALERGHHVTAVVRDPAKLTERHPNLAVESADIKDSTAVAEILLSAGADVLIGAVALRDPGSDPAAATAAMVSSLLEALRSLGDKAPYLVLVGGAGSLFTAPGTRLIDLPDFPDAYKPEASAHATALATLRGVSDVKWTYVSPAEVIAPRERTGAFRLGGDDVVRDDDGASFISAEDFAVVLIDEAEKREHVGKRFTAAY